MRDLDAPAQARAAALRARLADALSADLPDLSVGVEEQAVTIAGRDLHRRRIADARLRGIGIRARSLVG